MKPLHDPLLEGDRKDGIVPRTVKPSLPRRLAGEVLGTSLLVAFGDGCIMSNTYLSHDPAEVSK